MAVIVTIKHMEKKPENYIIDAIPLTRLPLARQQYFSYESSRKLPAGTLVEIPLFNRILNGIVINSRNDFHWLGNIKLKKIVNIIEENFLTAGQLELANFISDYYFCPLGIALKFFVPKQIKARNPKSEIRNTIYKKIKLTDEQKNAVNQITKSWKLEARSYLLFGPASSGKTEVYIHSIFKLKAKSPESQFLILLPELTLTPQAIERYGAYFKPEEMAVLHSKITKGEFYANWQKIKLGEAKIIIGTRMAVFAPFKNLQLIVIDEEQDMSFKQWDMNPRYDARTVAEKLAEIYKAKIVRGSATPSVESYYKAQNGEYKLLELPYLKEVRPLSTKTAQRGQTSIPPTAEVVDMKKERWRKNFSPISKTLKAEVEYASKNKLQTILFVNRQGMSAFSVCGSCRSVLKCPQCDRALVYGNSGIYKCPHCSRETGILTACPKCKGTIFKNIGLGTQKVEREINKLFPGAKVKRVDFEAMKKRKSADNLFQEFSRGDYDILIGTQMITKGWDNPRVGLIGIIDADNLVSLPDFNTDEKAFQQIVQAAGRTGRLESKFPGKIIIQTFNPENFIIQTAAERNFEKFYEKEIAERKDLKYPPFARLVKLICQNPNRQKVEKNAEKVYNGIKSLQSKEEGFTVSPPQDPLVSKVRKNYRKQIVLKLEKELSPDLKKILINLDGKWIVDVEPVSII